MEAVRWLGLELIGDHVIGKPSAGFPEEDWLYQLIP